MPESLKVSFFTFGAILLLISLIGGGFEILGARIPERIFNKWIRLTCFVFGVIFIVLATVPPQFLIKTTTTVTGNEGNGKGDTLPTANYRDCIVFKNELEKQKNELKEIIVLLENKPGDLKHQADKLAHQNNILNIERKINSIKCD